MEWIREIARSYYERAIEYEINLVDEFYTNLDINGDGKISLSQVENSGISSLLSSEDTFRKLDKNGDGALDFDDVLCLYYMEKRMKLTTCSECCDFLVGLYFTCFLCYETQPAYHLCCSCYRNRDWTHEHSSLFMFDHHSMAMALRRRTIIFAQREAEVQEDDSQVCQPSEGFDEQQQTPDLSQVYAKKDEKMPARIRSLDELDKPRTTCYTASAGTSIGNYSKLEIERLLQHQQERMREDMEWRDRELRKEMEWRDRELRQEMNATIEAQFTACLLGMQRGLSGGLKPPSGSNRPSGADQGHDRGFGSSS